jgi:phosphomannomutase
MRHLLAKYGLRTPAFAARGAFLRIYGAAVAISLALSCYLLFVEIPAERNADKRNVSLSEASTLADRLSQNIKLTQEQLKSVLDSPAARSAISEGSPKALSIAQAQLATAFPGAASLRLIRIDELGTSAMLAGTDKLRNHIEVDLIRRAQLESPAPEAYIVNGDSLVSFAAASTWSTEDGARAVLLLTRSNTYYRDLLTPTAPSPEANVSLGQVIINPAGTQEIHTILSSGNVRDGAPDATKLRVPESQWQILYQPSVQTVERLEQLPWMLIVSVLILLGIQLVAPWLIMARNQRELQLSIDQILLADATDTAAPESWPELQPLIDRLESTRGDAEPDQFSMPSVFKETSTPSFIKQGPIEDVSDLSSIMDEVRNRRQARPTPTLPEVEEITQAEAFDSDSDSDEVNREDELKALQDELEDFGSDIDSNEVDLDLTLDLSSSDSAPPVDEPELDENGDIIVRPRSVETDTVEEAEFDLSAFFEEAPAHSDEAASIENHSGGITETLDPSIDVSLEEDATEVVSVENEASVNRAERDENNVVTEPRRVDVQGLPKHIFRAYDIRGDAESELTDEVVTAIGGAIATLASDQGEYSFIVGCDGRLSSPRIKAALIQSLLDSGIDVVDIGIVPSPVLYFATHTLPQRSGLMITGSHNEANINGIKIVLDGKSLVTGGIQSLYSIATKGLFTSGKGRLSREDVIGAYLDRVTDDILMPSPLKIVVDAGNGAASRAAPALFERLGCEVVPMFCDIDGNFPNHSPDTSNEANLSALCERVVRESADLGVAFDGDGDRIACVDPQGNIIRTDKLMMILAKDVLSRNPGRDIVYDVKCSHHLAEVIAQYGGRPVLWKTGHALMKQKIRETDAILGGEFSGHIFFAERWYGFDDGIYTAARLAEIMSADQVSLSELLQDLPAGPNTAEILIPIAEDQKFDLINKVIAQADFQDGKLTTLDGLRVDFAQGWGLVRASNTAAALTARFEADSDEMLQEIQARFKSTLLAVDAELNIPF